MNEQELHEIRARLIVANTEHEGIEVKTGKGGTPRKGLREAICAFANRPGGGIIIVGINETENFGITGVQDPRQLMSDIADIASNDLTPPVRVGIDLFLPGDKPVVVVTVPEILHDQKPCFVTAMGMQNGAYERIGASNRAMTVYEVMTYLDYRAHRTFDDRIVERADVADIDRPRAERYLQREEQRNRRIRETRAYDDAIELLGIVRDDGTEQRPTLAGLLCFGTYPQQFLPQIRIVFNQYWGDDTTTRGPNGERYINDQEFDGTIDEMVSDATATVVQALPNALIVDGIRHRREPEIPEVAIREAIVNAVLHRDYSGYMIGSFIHIQLFRNRLVIASPGGLYGGIRLNDLAHGQTTRNPLLTRFMQDMDLVENRGGGIDEMFEVTRRQGAPPPRFEATTTQFRVIFERKNAPVDHVVREDGPEWVTERIDPVRHVLTMALRNRTVTNEDVRMALRFDRTRATRLLKSMVEDGLLEAHGERRGVYYTVVSSLREAERGITS